MAEAAIYLCALAVSRYVCVCIIATLTYRLLIRCVGCISPRPPERPRGIAPPGRPLRLPGSLRNAWSFYCVVQRCVLSTDAGNNVAAEAAEAARKAEEARVAAAEAAEAARKAEEERVAAEGGMPGPISLPGLPDLPGLRTTQGLLLATPVPAWVLAAEAAEAARRAEEESPAAEAAEAA